MKHQVWTVAMFIAIVWAVTSAQKTPSVSGGEDLFGPYEVVPNWPKPVHTDYTWGRTAAVWAQTPNRVYVMQTGELPVLEHPMGGRGAGSEYIPNRSAVREGAFAGKIVERMEHHVMMFDADGNMVGSFDKQFDDLFYYQHRLATNPWDPEQPVWICENGTNEIFKFSNDGKKILLRVGEHMKPGNDEYHFNGPNDIAFMPNGDFLIADGSRNRRIVRYSKDGKFLSQFGRDGNCPQGCPDMAPGDFGNLHAVAVDAKQRIYVADWGGGRIQIFDQYGKFLAQWPGIPRPSSISVSKDQKYVWVTDDTSNKILQYDMDGRLLYAWGTFGGQPGRMWGTHHLSVDSDGNLYVAEIYNGRAEKFRPRKGVDPSRLVGLLFKEHVN